MDNAAGLTSSVGKSLSETSSNISSKIAVFGTDDRQRSEVSKEVSETSRYKQKRKNKEKDT